MVNMKKEKESDCGPCMSESSEYPYGLRLHLDDDSIEKLGLETLPEVSTKMKITAIVDVCGVSVDKNKDEEYKRMDIQITDMEIVPIKVQKSMADSIYGSGDEE